MQQLRLFFAMALSKAIAKNKRNCCILDLFHYIPSASELLPQYHSFDLSFPLPGLLFKSNKTHSIILSSFSSETNQGN